LQWSINKVRTNFKQNQKKTFATIDLTLVPLGITTKGFLLTVLLPRTASLLASTDNAASNIKHAEKFMVLNLKIISNCEAKCKRQKARESIREIFRPDQSKHNFTS
jgi:hypothetical protein